MSVLLWALLIWFGPGLIAGVGLLVLTMWERRLGKSTFHSSRPEEPTGRNNRPLVQETPRSAELPKEAQSQAAAGLADQTEGTFMLRPVGVADYSDQDLTRSG